MKNLIAMILAGACLLGSAFADDGYPLIGRPVDPKVPAAWDFYRDYDAQTKLLQDLAAAHPDICRLDSIGTSWQGREMWVMTITNFSMGDEARKPAFWLDGGIHANEIQGSDGALYTAWFLIEGYSQMKQIREIVDSQVFYILPMMSPDSRDVHLHEAANTHGPRTGQRPIDNDRDGLFDEDDDDDLDGDGHIVSMRVKDPNGRWKEDEEYPWMMVRAEQDEIGGWTMLGEEGYDNDGDGMVNEDGAGGYDPNRDWGYDWQPGHIQWGAYRYPFSLQENRAVADFALAHPNIGGAQSFHNAGGMILSGPGAEENTYSRSDRQVYDAIGKRGEEMLPGYKYMITWEDLYTVHGGELDWWYASIGALAYTNEMWTSFNYFRTANDGNWQGDRNDQARFNDQLLFGEAFVPWHEVEHPDYGTVEVGGYKKSYGRQPPSFLLQEELHRNMAFTVYHASQLPRIRVDSVSVKQLDHGMTEVTAVIVNDHLIPTRLSVAERSSLVRPDIVSLKGGNGMKVLTAMRDNDMFFRRPREQQRDPGNVELSSVSFGDAVYVRWIVRGSGPFTVTADSVKGGVSTLKSE
ncbi:peptidase M14 [bacterium]|nr:peptidase M14 [bacterium]